MDAASLVVLFGILLVVMVISAFSVRHMINSICRRSPGSNRNQQQQQQQNHSHQHQLERRHAINGHPGSRQHRRRLRQDLPIGGSNQRKSRLKRVFLSQGYSPCIGMVPLTDPTNGNIQDCHLYLIQLPNRAYAMGLKS